MTKRKTDKRTNNDLHNTTRKLEIKQHEPPLKTGGEIRCSIWVGDLMADVLYSMGIDCGFNTRSGLTKNYHIVICCFCVWIFWIKTSCVTFLTLEEPRIYIVNPWKNWVRDLPIISLSSTIIESLSISISYLTFGH